ncbi:MAG TPA: FG-GAP-like repeat-containing protein [Rhodothermales bacterium]
MNRRTPLLALLLASAVAVSGAAVAQPFTALSTNIRPVTFGMLVVGDFNGNGRLDVFAGDVLDGNVYFSVGSESGVDFQVTVPVFAAGDNPVFHNGSADVADIDNDGDLDFLFAGDPEGSLIFKNDGTGQFARAEQILPGVLKSGMIDIVNSPASVFGDVDNDGDVDILLVGYVGNSNGAPTSRLFLNDGDGGFAEQGVTLPSTITGPPAWGDFDRDGDLDLLAACYCEAGTPSTRIFRNDGGGTFTDAGIVLMESIAGSTRWGDYDNDGDLDVLIAGRVQVEEQVSPDGSVRTFQMTPSVQVFANQGGTFVRDEQVLPSETYWADWADFDNDGDIDLVVNSVAPGESGGNEIKLRILANEGGRFGTVVATLPRVWNGDVAFGDLDDDGDLDIVASGVAESEGEPATTIIYRNDAPQPNTRPQPPVLTDAYFEGETLRLFWAPGNDAETPTNSLTYNLRVGTTPGGMDVVSPMSLSDGVRLVQNRGNVGPATQWAVHGLDPSREYYWSVQAIDHALRASVFAPEMPGEMPTQEEAEADVPTSFGIVDAYPNPFNPAATIRFATDRSGMVDLAMYDVHGRRVATLHEGSLPAGMHELRFDGKSLPSGVYFCRIVSGSRTDSMPIALVK